MPYLSIQLYLNKLEPDGLLVYHISNLHLDLGPVVGNMSFNRPFSSKSSLLVCICLRICCSFELLVVNEINKLAESGTNAVLAKFAYRLQVEVARTTMFVTE
jgi:hypothetical protein